MIAFDITLFELIHTLAGRSSLGDAAIIFFARVLPYFLCIGFFVLLADVRGFRARFFWFASSALAVILARGIIVELVRYVFHRVRPFSAFGFSPLIAESSGSMPSGHAAFFFALALVIYFMNRRWGMVYLIAAAVVTLSRIAAGVHYPSDILAGAAIGLASAYLVEKLLERYDPTRHEKAPEALEEASAEIAPPLSSLGDIV